jgi:hypothetical protein
VDEGEDEDDGTSAVRDALGLGWLGLAAAGVQEIATIWATVEIERVLRALGPPAGLIVSAVDDPLLGARIVVVDGTRGPADPTTGPIALAEPTTEGRLAGALARHGEGPAGRYLRVDLAIDEIARRAGAAGMALSRPAVGPFGREVLLLGAGSVGAGSVGPGSVDPGRGGPTGGPTRGPAAGQHLILVETAAVPSRP